MNFKNYEPTKTKILNFQKNTTMAKFLIPLAAVALLFLCSMCTPTNAAPTNDESTLKITYPSNASLVNIQETVTGTAENIPEGQKLWILVYPQSANKFYPQSGNVNIIDGKWSLTIGLGTKDNIGETFKIIAVLADQESSEEFTNYMSTGPSTGWPGIGNIPEGAKVVDEVTVTRLNPEINITYPLNTTSVNMQETVNGTAKNIPSGYNVWIFVYPLTANKFYPQSGNINIINGDWSLTIGIGNKENVGEQFKILALLANQKAHEELTNYVNTGKNTSIWPGIDVIPDGADIYNEVTVTRKIEPLVDITSPLNTAKHNDTITGTARYIPEEKAVWIIIYSHKAHKYHPQNKLDIQNGNWDLSAQFGLKDSIREQFDIIALLADQNAQNEFTTYLNESNLAQKWDGIQTLPNGTQELARVTVTRIGDLLPVADFTANPTSGYPPLTVQFTDLSQNVESRSWDFGDGINSTEQNPSHIYSSEGTYNINLVVSNLNGTVSKQATIIVEDGSSSSSDIDDGGSSHSSSYSSGGGGGGSPEPQSNVKAKEISQTFISNGKSAEFDFTRNVTPVVYVSFDSKKTFGKTSTIAEMLKEKSTLVSEPPSDEVYKYINIWVGNGGLTNSKNIENPLIAFRVEKSWIQEKNINKSSITLNKYNSDKKWDQLQTNLSGEDDKYLYLTVPTSGFSHFAITGKVTVGESVPIVKNEEDTIKGPIESEEISNSTQKQTPSTSGFEIVYCIVSLLAVFYIKESKNN
jgi:PGF-pre-PGF domain-containing protein